MAAPVLTTQVALNWSETAIGKDDYSDCQHFHYTKNSFYKQSKYKIAKKISNFFLSGLKARCSAPSGEKNEAENQWAALCAAHGMASKMPESQILVYLYDSARTHFIKNS